VRATRGSGHVLLGMWNLEATIKAFESDLEEA
jgi:hypothetical protein